MLVGLRQEGLPAHVYRTLAGIGVLTSGSWRWSPDGSKPHPVHSYKNQRFIAELTGEPDRRTVSAHVQELTACDEDGAPVWTWQGQPILRTQRQGSTAGCLAYGVPWVSRGGRHIRRDVLESEAFRSLPPAYAMLYMLLRDDYRIVGDGHGLDCRITGDDHDGCPALADRYLMAESTVREGLADLERIGLCKRERRYDAYGRDVGIRVILFDGAPQDAAVPSRSGRWLAGITTKVAIVMEELRELGGQVASELAAAWARLQREGGPSSGAAAAAACARVLRPYVRRERTGRRYPHRVLVRALEQLRAGNWRRAEAREEKAEREIIQDEYGEAALQAAPERRIDVIAGMATVLPPQGPAPPHVLNALGDPVDIDRRDIAAVWPRAVQVLRRFGGPDVTEALRAGRLAGIVDPCEDAEGGPVLWLCGRYLTTVAELVTRLGPQLRQATGCRIGGREVPQDLLDLAASRGPP